MNANLQFDFIVDKENSVLTVIREFAAEPQMVWDAYTKKELLEKWFAPRPWTAKTGHMDFREGGHWLYAMCGPDGEEHWARMDYQSITPITEYIAQDLFCDAEGNPNTALPQSEWKVEFKPTTEGNTVAHNTIKYNSLADLEVVLKMGMQEGLTMTLEQLDELLGTMKNK